MCFHYMLHRRGKEFLENLKNAMVSKMTPMAQTNVLGIVYGLVNDKQFE